MIASFSDVEFQKRSSPDDNKDGNSQWLNFNVIFDNIKRSDSIQIACWCLLIIQHYQKLTYRYQISSIFVGSLDTCYQLIYLLHLIWSRNTSAIKQPENILAALRKNDWQKPFRTGIKSTWNCCLSRNF